MFSPKTVRIQNLSRREYLFLVCYVANAKGGTYAVKDFLSSLPHTQTKEYHRRNIPFPKHQVVFRGHALVTYGNQLETCYGTSLDPGYFAEQ